MPAPSASHRPAASPLAAALFAALPVFAVLVYVPANIYLGNAPHFDHRHTVVLHLAVIHAAVTTALYLAFRLRPGLGEAASPLLGALGLFVILRASLAGTPVGELLDGRIGTLTEDWRGGAVDLAVLAGVWLVARGVARPTFVRTGAQFAAFAALALPAVVAFEAWRAPDAVARWASLSRPAPAPAAAGPNVYHLVFDGFDASLAPLLIARLRLAGDFAGFVLYPRAYANYTSTRLSFPSFMTGRAFDAAMTDAQGAAVARSEGLVATLGEHGYTTTQYNAYFVNNHALAHVRRSAAALEAELAGGTRQLVQLLDLSILTVLPTGTKSLAVRGGRGLVSHWLWSDAASLADWSRSPPALSIRLFERMIREEASRPASGQYVNAHLLLPHAPHTLDAGCRYDPRRTDSRQSLVEQAACSLRTLARFTRRLRALGRFRDALILVHADHGTLHRERPLLLVKYPGRGDEPLEAAGHAVQLLDVAPTIHAVLGLPVSGLAGADLRDASADARDEIKVWVAKPGS